MSWVSKHQNKNYILYLHFQKFSYKWQKKFDVKMIKLNIKMLSFKFGGIHLEKTNLQKNTKCYSTYWEF